MSRTCSFLTAALCGSLFFPLVMSSPTHVYCSPADPCWPTSAEIAALSDLLDPTANRTLVWSGPAAPRVAAVPLDSPNEQPLYGAGVNMQPVYTEEPSDRSSTCFDGDFHPEYCLLSTRNGPDEGWTPSFIVWPLTPAHVAASVKFARQHNLCIMVAGSGHEFNNRHSCNNGFFIRTSLLKSIEFDNNDSKGFGHDDGNVRFGAGIVFSEVQHAASAQGRFVSSGWGITVGIAGWSLGGGHGPFANQKGLGVDNILEIDVVTADGDLVTANAQTNSDLFWAMRGGGGSTWGVMTAITVKTHLNPPGGFTVVVLFTNGTMCGDGKEALSRAVIDGLQTTLQLDTNKWSSLWQHTPFNDSGFPPCYTRWQSFWQAAYLGPPTDPEVQNLLKALQASVQPKYLVATPYKSWWDFVEGYSLSEIYPTAIYQPRTNYVGGVPSVLLSRDAATGGELGTIAMTRMLECEQPMGNCARQEFYLDLEHPAGSAANVSISAGFRSAAVHYIAGFQPESVLDKMYTLGNNSYLSESAYDMPDWQHRLWGENYAKLLAVKESWDPNHVFWCRHCIGDDSD